MQIVFLDIYINAVKIAYIISYYFFRKSVTNKQYSPVTRSLIVGSLFEIIYDHDDGDVITSTQVALEAVGRRAKSREFNREVLSSRGENLTNSNTY